MNSAVLLVAMYLAQIPLGGVTVSASGATPTVVQATAGSTFGASPRTVTMTFSSSIANGDVLLVQGYGYAASGTWGATPGGTCVVSWSALTPTTSDANQAGYVGSVTSGGGSSCTVTVTYTWTGASNGVDTTGAQIHNSGSTTIDKSDTSSGFCTSCNFALSGGTSHDGDMICGMESNGAGGNTASSPWAFSLYSNSTGVYHMVNCYVQTSHGAIATPAFTSSGDNTHRFTFALYP